MASEKSYLLSSDENGKKSSTVGFKPSKRDEREPVPLVSIRQLFRYCDNVDKLLIVLGVLGALLYGMLTPMQFILLGSLTDDFVDYALCHNNVNCTEPPDLEDSVTTMAYWYVALGVANFLFSWMGMGLFGLSAERQVHKLRLATFRSAIYQEIGWFDAHSSGELNTRLTEDMNKIIDGIGSKFGRLLSSVATFFAGYVVGFIYGWKVTLVMMAMFPVSVVVGAVMTTVTGNYTTKELEAYSKAGHIAEQSISSIRTVEAFGGEERQAELYDNHLEEARNFGVKKGFAVGAGVAFFHLTTMVNMALSFWYIIKLVRDDEESPGDGMTVFFAVTLASMILGQAGPSAEALATARGAAFVVFEIIDRESKIDASSDTGLKPAGVKGNVEFAHIDFVYPTRSSVPVLKDFSLKVPSGKRVALVGQSGCGKSTVVKLIQRFYDPRKGHVKLDGQNIKDINVSHLRRLIGVVNQEPVLFATTIAENIAYGREGVIQQEIEKAAKMANAHDFIMQFPRGYNTLCGERGAQMSGGQKQRIAIARALVRNPKILLLDEATSALDTESEAVVQDALDRAGEGRTTIIIAHRLSTIKNADLIVAVSEGHVAEMGTHDELMALDGLYSSLVKLQEGHDGDNDEDENVTSFKIGEDGAFQLSSLGTTVTEHQTRSTQPDDKDDIKPVSFCSILKMNSPEWRYLLIGCLGAAVYGIHPCFFGYSFGAIYDIFAHNASIPEESEEMKEDSEMWALLYLTDGIVTGCGVFLQHWHLAKAGEGLTKRLRKKAFLAFLRKEIGYYDHSNHGTGAVCTRLAVEVSAIQGATGSQLGLVAAGLVTTIGGIFIAFSASWRLSLVLIAFIPILIASGWFMTSFLGGGAKSSATSRIGQAAEETLSNIQTVVSLGREEEFFERYHQALAAPYKKARRNCHLSGLATGSFYGIINISMAAAYRYSGYLITEGDITLKDMMTALNTILACTTILGTMASMTPDYTKAKQAANRVFHLLTQVPRIDSYSEEGTRPDVCTGEVELSNVRFTYPTRRNYKVLRNLSFTIKPGQTVALVGTSGCGKSTSVSLVERFYDVNSGSVMIDGNDVRELNVKWLRSQIGIVSQEPVLFDLSIRDNIAYGDTTRNISDKEIEEAARSANIHEFITALPQGYDTVVGDKGTLISGGQKQRIAIARALIRDPKILLLDEATSALDTESEKVVQQALDKASVGRTTLIIAHRLSTIQHADAIVVIKKGRVVERGTHQQLLAMKGIYHTLHKAQSMATTNS